MADLQKRVTATKQGGTVDLEDDEWTLTVPLFVKNRTLVGDGAIIVAPDSVKGSAVHCRGDVKLLGDVTVIGPKPNDAGYTKRGDLEFQHGIVAEGVTSLESEWGVRDVWGDGYYIGKGPDLTGKERARWSENVTVHGANVRRTGRQGLTVVAGRHVLFEDLEIEDTGRSVVDLEPPGRAWGVVDFVWRHSVAIGGHGVLLANKGKSNSECDGITVEDIDAEDRAVNVRVVSLQRRRKNYRVAALRTNVRVLRPPLTFWNVDGLELETSTMDIPTLPTAETRDWELWRQNGCTDVVVS